MYKLISDSRAKGNIYIALAMDYITAVKGIQTTFTHIYKREYFLFGTAANSTT